MPGTEPGTSVCVSGVPAPAHVTCVIWLLGCGVAFSNTGTGLVVTFIVLGLATGWMLVWGVRLVLWWRKRHQGPGSPTSARHGFCYWVMEPGALLAGCALAASGLTAQARFALSEPYLADYVQAVRDGRVGVQQEFNHAPRQVGLYQLASTELLPDGTVRIITASHGLLDRAGFANAPAGQPLKMGEDVYRPLRGHWWLWYESW